MKKMCFYIIGLLVITVISSGCCSWNYDKEDFEFTREELNLMGAYQLGDTIYFESNLGNVDTITVVEISEERHEGSKCFITTEPQHFKDIKIKHLPNDKWAGTSQSEGEEKKITYQSLISITKSPLDSIEKIANYGISYKRFTTLGNALDVSPKEVIINNKVISDCYKVEHGYPERVINPDDIETVYWTAKYGLTAYINKAGEIWVIKNLY